MAQSHGAIGKRFCMHSRKALFRIPPLRAYGLALIGCAVARVRSMGDIAPDCFLS